MGNLNQVLGSGYNAANVETSDNEPLPAGEYIVQVDSAELRQTKAGTGTGCNMTFEVVDGNAIGRKLFNWFNLAHENPKAAQIGQGEFASLCKSLGVLTPQDTDELLGKFCVVRVAIKDGRNEIKGYKPAPTNASSQPVAPTVVVQQSPVAAAPTATVNRKMPWQK
jgi:hypothetical protein